MGYYGAIHCGYCYQKGHNKVSCEKRKEHIEERRKEDPNNWVVQSYDEETAARKVRRCKYCEEIGHNRRSCVVLKENLNQTLSDCSEWRKNALNAINDLGLGVGSLVLYDNQPVLVMDFLWGHGSHYAAVDMDNTENYKELFAYTNYHTRPRTPLLLKIKRLDHDRWGQTEIPFPRHPLVAPFSDTTLLSPAPKSFADSAPEGWVADSPPHRVMEKFNPDRW